MRAAVIAALSTSLVACSSGGGDAGGATGPTTSAPSTSDVPAITTAPTTAAPTTAAPGTAAPTTPPPTTAPAALSPREVLDAVGPSIAFVSTDIGTGTAWAIEDGYLLTSAHVITPFVSVDVTPPGGDAIEDVPVVGVDLTADIALLGPLDEPLPPLPLDAPAAVGGDAVFLIGYPSETETSPTPTISQGIVSRVRELPDFDQTYVQTDADIAGGQSGGALVDAAGRVVGISGMSLDEAFALALSVADVNDRLDALRRGGDEWHPYPDDGVTEGTVTVPGVDVGAVLVSVPTDTDTELSFTLSGADDLGLEVFVDDGTYLISASYLTATAEEFELTEDELLESIGAEVLERDDAGGYTFTLPAGIRATFLVSRFTDDTPADVSFTSSVPLAPIADLDDDATIAVGDVVNGLIEPLEWQDVFVLELTEGETVTITAASAVGDMAFDFLQPGETVSAASIYVDDSDIGLGGLDSQLEFTAEVSGPHRLILTELSGAGGYVLTVV
jgi:S1-C subfamily serine protease